jgi:hypothetical protein
MFAHFFTSTQQKIENSSTIYCKHIPITETQEARLLLSFLMWFYRLYVIGCCCWDVGSYRHNINQSQ